MADRISGTIARIVVDKGFFFIKASGGDYFGHRTALENCTIETLAQGDRVTFHPSESPKGPRAEAIVVEGGR